MIPNPQSEDRGVSQTASHVLAIGITALLISALMLTGSGILNTERDQTSEEQLQIVGNRIADDISRASRLAQDGGNITITNRYQSQVSGDSYTVDLLTGGACDTNFFTTDTCLQLDLSGSDTSVMVPVHNDSAVSLTATGDGRVKITSEPAGSAPANRDPPVNIERNVGVGDDIDPFGSGNAVNLTNRRPISGFIFSPGQPTVDSVIHFQNDTDDLDGIIESYEWDLGDGTEKSGVKEFNHSYADPGKYTVNLTVTDDDDKSDSVEKQIEVSGLVYNEDVVGGSGNVTFSLTNKHSATVEITEIYLHPDDDSIDRLDNSSGDEVVIDADVADDNDELSDHDIHPGGRIIQVNSDSDTAQLSGGSDANLTFYGFEDGGSTFNMAGEKVEMSIRYTVDGELYSSKFTLNGPGSSDQPPVPEFTDSCTGTDCTFDGSGSHDPDAGQGIDTYEWDFGDGNNDTGVSPGNSYNTTGDYTVSLTVTSDNGVTSTLVKSVTVGNVQQWFTGWNKRKEITIHHDEVAGDLADFPVLIDITDTDLADHAQDNGDDILFTARDGSTQLNHEIESFDDTSGDLVAWVNVTDLDASSNTTLYMYYNNSGASNQENLDGTWGPKYDMVLHLEDLSDSSGNNNDATNNNANQVASAKIGGGYDFVKYDGNRHLEIPDSINNGQFSIQLWFRAPTYNWGGTFFDATDGDKYFHITGNDDELAWCLEGSSDNDMQATSSVNLNSGDWHHVVATAEFNSNGPHELYLDGSEIGQSSTSLNNKPSTDGPWIGEELDDYDGCGIDKDEVDDELDEIRILSEKLSSAWIQTEYNNQNSPSSFYTVGPEESLYQEGGDGEVAMEAENYMDTVPGNDADFGPSNGDSMVDQTWSNFSDPTANLSYALEATPNQGDSALDTENGERLDYSIDFQTTGTYNVWVRMKCPSASDDSIHVGLNGTPTTYGGNGLNANSTENCYNVTGWMWANESVGSQTNITVGTAEPHTFNIWMLEDGVMIDKIVLTTDDSFDPRVDPVPNQSPTS